MDIEGMKDYMETRVDSAGYERVPWLKWSGITEATGFGYIFAKQDVRAESTAMTGETVAIESRR
jgi:hypothetical protein